MKGTMQALAWAFALEDIEPESKLLAIYIASQSGADRDLIIDEREAAKFMGYRLKSSKGTRRGANTRLIVQKALQGIPGIVFDRIGDHGYEVRI